jgi:hypothetical protein
MSVLTVPNSFGLIIASAAGQPTALTVGTAVPADANADTKSSYVELLNGSAVTDDAYGIAVTVSSTSATGTSRAALFDVGVDPDNGGSYTDLIANLLFAPANTNIFLSHSTFYFPLFIKAGTQIAMRHQCATGAVDAQARVALMCRPSRPDAVNSGTYCTTFGADTANSTGTNVTAGTTSEGSWTQLGSATSRPHFFWHVGIAHDSTTQGNNSFDCDLACGDGSTYSPIIEQERFSTNSAEAGMRSGPIGGRMYVPSGSNIYGRSQGSANTTIQLAAYGVG